MLSSIIKGIGVGITASVVGLIVAIIGIIAIFVFAIFGALMGAVTGFILHITPWLGPVVEQGFSSFGIVNPNLVAIGAMLGFIAGFFKPSLQAGKN